MKKGDLNSLRIAMDEKISITVLKKDFSKMILNKIRLENSIFSKCLFTESSFYGNEYNCCDFIGCDFSKANLLNVKFINCKFHDVKFNETELEDIIFDNCTILNCHFNEVKLSSNVLGLNENDMNVIAENDENNDFNELIDLGFEKQSNDLYKIEGDNNVEIVVTKDPEYGQYVWRVMLKAKDESLLSDTIDIEDEIDLTQISMTIKNIIYFVKKNLLAGKYSDIISNDDKSLIEIGIKEIIKKFKPHYENE